MKKIISLQNTTASILAVVMVFISISGCIPSSQDNNTMQNAISYIQETDFQYYLGSYCAIAKVRNGYYFISDSHLMYFDAETKHSYPVCNKANCEHNTDKCTALLSAFKFSPTQLLYYNNALYLLGWESEGVSTQHNYLYRISLDTYKRERLIHICDSTDSIGIAILIHRGYVYFYYGGPTMQENTLSLYRANLEKSSKKSTPEFVFEYTGIGAAFVGFNAYANHLHIGVSAYADEQGNGYNSALYDIDIHTLQSKKILDSYPYSYFADSNYVYYEKNENTVNRIDINTNKEERFCNIDGPAYICADSNYIYFDNLQSVYIEKTKEQDRKILVYDKTGKYITEITPKNPKDDCYFGGDDVMIFKEVIAGEAEEADGAKGYYVLDKSQLTSPNKEFIDMQ